VVDKFAGDALMATFNVTGATVDHCLHALQATIALRDKAALLDLPLGIGLAVGPAVVGHLADGANLSVLGEATNMASRLQATAGADEVLLTEDAFRRVHPWLEDHGLKIARELVSLKGLREPVPVYVLRRPKAGAAFDDRQVGGSPFERELSVLDDPIVADDAALLPFDERDG
jgi:adenylate cyclase